MLATVLLDIFKIGRSQVSKPSASARVLRRYEDLNQSLSDLLASNLIKNVQ